MPASVSAIRTGRLPSRGCGVTVFVTNDVERAGDFRRLERVQAAGRVQDHAASRTGPATQSRCSTPSISTEQP